MDQMKMKDYATEIAETSYYKSKEEEQKEFDLLMAAKASGDPDAYMTVRNDMVEHNMRLVLKIANMYGSYIWKSGLTFEDVLTDGMIGLIQSVETWNPDKRVDDNRFSTYAWHRISRAILKSVEDQKQSRLLSSERWMRQGYAKLYAAKNAIESNVGRKATLEEMVKGTGYTEEKIKTLLECTTQIQGCIRIDGLEDSDETSQRWEITTDETPESIVDEADEKASLELAIEELPTEAMRKVIRMRYGLGEDRQVHTCVEIAGMMGVSKQRINDLEHKAIAKLRDSAYLQDYK